MCPPGAARITPPGPIVVPEAAAALIAALAAFA